MTQRERTLALAVAAVAALWAGTQGLSRYQAAAERNRNVESDAVEALDDARFAVERGERARRKLLDFRARSLPVDRQVAESLYQDWLRKQFVEAGLKVSKLAETASRARSPQFDELSMSLEAEGELAQVIDALYRFYAAPHVHRLSAASLTADKEGRKLNVALTIDALILPGAAPRTALAELPAQPRPRSLDEVKKELTARNMFAAYTPAATASDDSAEARLTGATYGERGWRLDVRLKSEEMRHFYVGDAIEIGQFQGKFIELAGRRVVFETSRGRLEARLGEKLGDAKPAPSPAS